MKHKHAELIHAWADGAEIEGYYPNEDMWIKEYEPKWSSRREFRIYNGPKGPEWWDNIPNHGILCKSKHSDQITAIYIKPVNLDMWTPLTNDEIKEFLR